MNNNNVNYPNNAGTVNNPNNAGNVNNPNNPNDPNANKVDNTARINAIAKEFVNYYYQTFDADRKNLAALYRPMSMMTWEGVQLRGGEAIIEKLAKVGHKITTTDAQQSLPHVNALVIMVTGQLLVDEETKPQQFSQTFQLVEDNGFFVYNDVFRLNYA